jgi:arginase
MQKVEILGVASGWAAQVRDSEFGPEVLRKCDLFRNHPNVVMKEIVYPEKSSAYTHILIGKETKHILNEFFQRVLIRANELMDRGSFPIFFGGDHGNAIATWTSVIKKHKAKENFGLIWIDAHMDAHTYDTSPSKAFHGMPLACLLGHGEEGFVGLGGFSPKITPSVVVLIGIRSYEKEEREFLENLGVKIFYGDDVKTKGFDACFNEALKHISAEQKKFGVTLDLDFFDPEFAPATPSLEPNGIDPKTVLPSLAKLPDMKNFSAFEIVEFSPSTDKDGITLKLIQDIIAAVIPKS